jgi:hypothetical protein
MKDILILCGYSRSGKTSLLNELKEEGWSVASTSQVLDTICYRLLNLYGITGVDFENKKGDVDTGQIRYTPREFKIAVAEDIIAPLIGRESLVRASLKRCNKDKLVCESIGGDELDILLDIIKNDHPDSRVLVLNMRSALELTGVDIRKLATKEQCLPHVLKEYHNLYIPFRGLKDYFDEFFKVVS